MCMLLLCVSENFACFGEEIDTPVENTVCDCVLLVVGKDFEKEERQLLRAEWISSLLD